MSRTRVAALAAEEALIVAERVAPQTVLAAEQAAGHLLKQAFPQAAAAMESTAVRLAGSGSRAAHVIEVTGANQQLLTRELQAQGMLTEQTLAGGRRLSLSLHDEVLRYPSGLTVIKSPGSRLRAAELLEGAGSPTRPFGQRLEAWFPDTKTHLTMNLIPERGILTGTLENPAIARGRALPFYIKAPHPVGGELAEQAMATRRWTEPSFRRMEEGLRQRVANAPELMPQHRMHLTPSGEGGTGRFGDALSRRNPVRLDEFQHPNGDYSWRFLNGEMLTRTPQGNVAVSQDWIGQMWRAPRA